ncbi:hypothetical protein CFH99_07350 [Nocardioides aromaticivorans]|uniref:Endonuclease V n=1 Tax=Nocardioides aromaticivorans TaxID=200618 RepID=A0ABX7PI39_9ACTN|nr:endonuclease V [Nocardioides aromaticivorans]QSR25440.1 hypothetical protein CFH99_07350 [Nocardioides aromaticivorans]
MDGVTRVGAVDVHYDDDGGARAALIVCDDSTCSTVTFEHVVRIARTLPYESGALYKRELPCIQAVLTSAPPVDLLLVDGYATLDPKGRPGLGAHAARAFGIPVIGVAKTSFRSATHAIEVIRGAATRPLYVTTAGGVPLDKAARLVAAVAGSHRLPDALARADRLARGREEPRTIGPS